MVILGIDPGYAIVGYGVIDVDARGRCTCIDYGAINTSKDEDFPVRLAMIQDGMNALIQKYKPEAVAVEELFFNQNITTGIAVAEARGVILCTAIQSVPKVFEFTPMQIKLAITGNGRAEKKQVEYMTKNLLKLKNTPKPDDAADALAVALCLSQTNLRVVDSEVKVFTNNTLKKTNLNDALKKRGKK
ncbi:MAG: crossover junction endodeoxyribonuclease RuvC [Clostridia bacterium]|nr:crossover junction endodeoxyribonuclease RuvC [Clostridia bacterium]